MLVSGRVQGVGFRSFAESRAGLHAATGYVRNLGTREVEVVAEGDRRELEALLTDLRRGPRSARVAAVSVRWESPSGDYEDFSIRH